MPGWSKTVRTAGVYATPSRESRSRGAVTSVRRDRADAAGRTPISQRMGYA
jgi:hypothetical protein